MKEVVIFMISSFGVACILGIVAKVSDVLRGALIWDVALICLCAGFFIPAGYVIGRVVAQPESAPGQELADHPDDDNK